MWIGHYSGAAFPSEHAAQSIAFYAMLAIVLGAARSPRAKTVLWSVAALVTLAEGGSRALNRPEWPTAFVPGLPHVHRTRWTAVIGVGLKPGP